MPPMGLLVRIEAKPEHATEVESMLRGALELARQEQHTLTWFAFQEAPTIFGVFDTFDTDAGRAAHLEGPIAAALVEAADSLLASPPVIVPFDVLAEKLP